MDGLAATGRRSAARILCGLLPAMLVGGLAAAPEPASLPAPLAGAEPPLTLEACRKIAFERQPTLAAARASLDAALARARAVENLHVPTLLARDLPVRRKQAPLGVATAEAALLRVENDVQYAVTYSYLSALYALEQREVARKAAEDLKDLQESVQSALAKGAREVFPYDVPKVAIYRDLVQARLEEAEGGVLRALSALREAMGVGPDFPLALARATLYRTNPTVDGPAVAACALARRPELIQTATFAQITAYEIDAQQVLCTPTARTFAATGDVHASPVPAGSYNEVYRPAGDGPEMPTALVGSKADRVAQARAYNARAEAVAEKARGLVTLEAEQTFVRWREASRQLSPSEKAAENARSVADKVLSDFKKLGTVDVDRVIRNGNQANLLRAQVNQTRYQMLLALAALERVTAGGFCAGFETPTPNGH